MKILDISALQILDSRGNPTLQVTVILEDGSKGTFSVPSGASTGIHEAHELRDKNDNLYHGKSVLKAVENVDRIANELHMQDFSQESLDQHLLTLDGTEDKSLLGANAILGVSVAFAKACAKHHSLPLHEYLYRLISKTDLKAKSPSELGNIHLFANVINGGLHSGNELKIQEFMIIPNLNSMNSKVRAISEVYQALKKIISDKYGGANTAVGDEGGFAPNIIWPREALELLNEAITATNYQDEMFIALDAAASDFYNKETKKYNVEKDVFLNYKELTKYYNDLVKEFPIISIEDPMAEDDFQGFEHFMAKKQGLAFKNPLTNSKELLVVGDDLLVTNPARIKTAVEDHLCNSLLLKINQIGTLTESIEAFRLSTSNSWHTIVSHRSGETTDDFISDLAVAMSASIKLGAPARGERVAKYNRLLNIYN